MWASKQQLRLCQVRMTVRMNFLLNSSNCDKTFPYETNKSCSNNAKESASSLAHIYSKHLQLSSFLHFKISIICIESS